jgi:uncharacterized membrane protein YidH (DUF202 family)
LRKLRWTLTSLALFAFGSALEKHHEPYSSIGSSLLGVFVVSLEWGRK